MAQQPQVEAPLFSSFRRTPTRRPTTHPSFHEPEEEPRMHPLEKLKYSTDIIGTIGTTGAQLYADIQAGRASAAEIAYYNQLMQQ